MVNYAKLSTTIHRKQSVRRFQPDENMESISDKDIRSLKRSAGKTRRTMTDFLSLLRLPVNIKSP